MPIVLAVNGVAEVFPVKPVIPRLARIESDPQQDKRPSDQSVAAAQTAYRQQSRQSQTLKPALLARDLMSTPVITLPSDSTLAESWAVMQAKGFRHVPITSMDGTLVGIVSDRDLLHHAPELTTIAASSEAARRVADIMTSRVISATPGTDIRDIAKAMLEARIHAVPVLDSSRKPIGMLTARDLLRGIAHHGPLELWT
jgi:acetoin utilization protein AcuB